MPSKFQESALNNDDIKILRKLKRTTVAPQWSFVRRSGWKDP